MTEEVRLEVIKKTQDLLGKYFKKPPLTEKLLRKPPFRFLHDIISAIIKQTGFLDGLFTVEELNSDNIKDKEAKLAFLTKLIDVMKLISGVNLMVRASKIISGQEPTKTNELLQAIGKALDKKISSTEAIEHYKKSQEKKAKAGSKSKTSKEEKKTVPRQSSQTRKSSEKDKNPTERKKRSSSTGKVTSSEARNKTKTNDKKETKEETVESSKSIETIDIPPAEPVENIVLASAQKKKRPFSSAKTKQDATSAIAAESAEKEEQVQRRSSSSRARHSAQANGSLERLTNLSSESKILNNEEQNKSALSNDNKGDKENGILEKDKLPQQNDEKSSDLTSQIEAMEMTVSKQSIPNARPKTSLRPPSARPISARPAAPRIRTKTELIVNEEIQTPVGNISVIIENSDLKDDDDAEDMVVMEAKRGNNDVLENGDYKIDSQLMQEHGHLVAQILETQRELVNTDNVDVMPKKVDIAWETGSKRDREAAIKEIDKLRGTIQTLTRTTNPLGKLLDYVQEDVEMMHKELLDWKNQYRRLNEQLEKEQKETQEMIEPMKETLKEIKSNINIQQDKIYQVKSQIMKNNQKIQRLLDGHI